MEPQNNSTELKDGLLFRAFRSGYKAAKEGKDLQELPEIYEKWLKSHDDGFPYPVSSGKPVSKELILEMIALAQEIDMQTWAYSDDMGEPCVLACRETDISTHCFQIAKQAFAGTPANLRWMAHANPSVILSLIDEVIKNRPKLDQIEKLIQD